MPMPPPPPPGGFSLGEPRKMDFKPSASGDGRGLLLDSIRKGTKLKKTVTVDKSAPAIGNVVGNQTASSISTSQNTKASSPALSNTVSTGANGQPLAGIFANGMPKLKPVGSRSKAPSQAPNTELSNKTVPIERVSPNTGYKPMSNGSTLHMKTKSNVEMSTKFSASEIKRGPPPQPPAPKSQMPQSASDSGLSPSKNSTAGSISSLNTIYNTATLKKTVKNNSVTNLSQNNNGPNQSSLFANKSNLHASLSALNQNNKLSTTDHGASLSSLVNTKTVINHGKPNLAPKPPSLNANSKPSVMRAHSMRSPRTPPITPPGLLPFGTLRGPPAGFHQSQDSIKMKPAPPIPGRPTIPPPIRPPANRPPPPPSRSISNTTVTPSQNPASPKPATTNQPPNQTPNQTSNQAPSQNKPAVPNKLTLTPSASSPQTGNSPAKPSLNLMSGINNAPMGVPPPPPPHRSQPAPQPPTARPAATNAQAPTPPVRHSSMRNCNGNGGTSVAAVIVDLETRFADMFHSMNDLPFPIHFCEVRKTYNSKNHMKPLPQQNMVSKQQSFSKPQAPLPPMQPATLQLGGKLYSDETTDC